MSTVLDPPDDKLRKAARFIKHGLMEEPTRAPAPTEASASAPSPDPGG
jgi:hypothetical protein